MPLLLDVGESRLTAEQRYQRNMDEVRPPTIREAAIGLQRPVGAQVLARLLRNQHTMSVNRRRRRRRRKRKLVGQAQLFGGKGDPHHDGNET